MRPLTTQAFDLPDHLAHKRSPALVDADARHFAAVAAALAHTVDELTERLDAVRRSPAGHGQSALERDQQVHRLSARLRALQRFGLDLTLGRMVGTADPEPVYVGRFGLTDADGRRLLVDWRSPAAAPFFGATLADPMGLLSRRRYRWSGGRVRDYWDEVFTADGRTAPGTAAALDDESAFIASLGADRSDRMRDVLGTIAADQDAVIRAGSRGALVVDGGPGTGKTVVALHRTAYLLHADPRLGHRRGGVLVVGPHEPYLAYVSDVLPSLGEEGAATCTLRDLVPEGAHAAPEADPEVARLKASLALVRAVDPAVALYEEPPTTGQAVTTPWAELWVGPDDWATAFEAPAPGTPHNEAREAVWDELLTILVERHGPVGGDGDEVDAEADAEVDAEVDADQVRRVLERDADLRRTLHRAWPMLEATDVVGDLWTVPAYLRRCAPELSVEQVRALQREDPSAWTVSDLPLLDAARHRLGDPDAAGRRRRQASAVAAERAARAAVAEHLVAADDSEMHLMSMLRGTDLQSALDDVPPDIGEPHGRTGERARLDGPYAHVVVDEAQELTDAEWQMVLARCPSRSLTVVGDRAQARRGFTESWEERLARVGLGRVEVATLTVNYRTPEEVMVEAEPVIRAALPDANVPTSIRAGGHPVVHGDADDLHSVVERWVASHPEGVACVVGAPAFATTDRVRSLPPELTKGLEFDLVVLVDPGSFGSGVVGAVDRYVAMTRATQQLVVLTSRAC
ncbi:RNA polymerase recycling motor ATPase HelR [Terrabacter sp. NPDC000476]|uniref:RNA polymerase recycling motor ATPase HelR n=1 Tax=Terrabacter sp. NPDC000476 TaxID=3154258 RepID=UPI00332AC7FC